MSLCDLLLLFSLAHSGHTAKGSLGNTFQKCQKIVVVSQVCLLHTSHIIPNFVFNPNINVFADLNTSSLEPAKGFYLGKLRGF